MTSPSLLGINTAEGLLIIISGATLFFVILGFIISWWRKPRLEFTTLTIGHNELDNDPRGISFSIMIENHGHGAARNVKAELEFGRKVVTLFKNTDIFPQRADQTSPHIEMVYFYDPKNPNPSVLVRYEELNLANEIVSASERIDYRELCNGITRKFICLRLTGDNLRDKDKELKCFNLDLEGGELQFEEQYQYYERKRKEEGITFPILDRIREFLHLD